MRISGALSRLFCGYIWLFYNSRFFRHTPQFAGIEGSVADLHGSFVDLQGTFAALVRLYRRFTWLFCGSFAALLQLHWACVQRMPPMMHSTMYRVLGLFCRSTRLFCGSCAAILGFIYCVQSMPPLTHSQICRDIRLFCADFQGFLADLLSKSDLRSLAALL